MRIPEESALVLVESDDDALMARVGPAAWAQGVAAYRSGRVVSLENDVEPGAFTGRVRDRGLSYKTWVSTAGGELSLTCACPEGTDCFHSVALLLALREEVASARPPASPWRARLVSLVGERATGGEPLGLLVDAHDPRAPILLEPLRRGHSVPWTRKRAGWPDLVSTQWASVTDGLDPVHLALLREGYRLAHDDSSWHSRHEVPLSSLGEDALAWLRRLERDGVALFASLDPLTPLVLDTATWDLGVDVRGADDGLVLSLLARNGEETKREPRIDAGTGLLVLDGGTCLARLSGSELAAALPERSLAIPASDLAEFTTSFLPRLKRQYALTSTDESVDLDAPPSAALVATARIEANSTLVVRWWAEFDYAGSPSRVPLARALDAPGVADLARRIDALGAERAPAELWRPGPATIRLPAWRTPEFRERVVAAVADPALHWDLSDEAAALGLDEVPLRVRAGLEPADGDSDWFDLAISLDVDGVPVRLADVLEALAAGERHLLVDGHWVSLDADRFARLAVLLEEARLLADSEEPRLAALHRGLWEEIEETADEVRAAAVWRERARSLDEVPEIPLVDPEGAKLRPYQREGAAWLVARAALGLGGILADDMGLGKTLQILAALAALRAAGRTDGPVLVVAPTSVLSIWKREAARFYPDLAVEVVSETARRRERGLDEVLAGADLVVTSYTILRLEAEEWAAAEFSGLVVDEAQAAKNPRTAIHKALRALRAPWAFAVTGTPVENSLSDLWAVLALTTPGLLPKWSVFAERMRRPIENDGDEAALDRLHRLIGPFMLRRTKEDVAADLPDKVETVVAVDLGAEHRRIYDERLMRERARVLSLVDDAKRRIDVLASITRLRQLALDPALVEPDYAQIGSAKVEYLADRLDEIVPRGHRALVFSQFTSFLARIREVLERRGIAVVQLDGSTTRRDEVVERFRAGKAPVFLISLKAGGTGLTLTEADYVYVMDPWWNPAAEAQAVDRAHRIGQTKKVNVYRLVAAGTIEEKVVALQERKRHLVTSVVEGAGAGAGLDLADLAELLD